ncbi:MAG: hypothetical protein ACYS26_19415 [Planctomycetota bacterium]|jgi:hypothetical protein
MSDVLTAPNAGTTADAELVSGSRPGRLARALRTLLGALPAVALVWALSVGTLDAGLISDDGAALGYVDRAGPFADLHGPQYGLESIRFWRPWVTTSLGLQLESTGTDPLPLRLLNLGCLALACVLACGLGGRVGGHPLAGPLVALAIASFAFQGGTVTWIVGRVDSQCLPGVLMALWGTVTRRPAWALAGLVWAAGTKEMGFVAAPAATVLLWIAGRTPGQGLRQAGALWIGTAALLALRRVALGEWVGGYAVRSDFPWGALPSVAGTLIAHSWKAHLTVLLAAGALRLAGRAPWRALVGAWLLFLGGGLLLAPLIAEGGLAPEHRRWLCLPEALLWLGAAGLWQLRDGEPNDPGRSRSVAPIGWAAAALILLAVAEQGLRARQDTLRWAAAGELAELHVERARQALEGEVPSPLPVWDATPPRTNADGTAYVLHWGYADRFREPFLVAHRPVWPWRPIWGHPAAQRDPVTIPKNDLRWGFGETQKTVPDMPVRLLDEGQRVEEWVLDERLLQPLGPGEGPDLVLFGEYPTPRIEFVLFTELGHEPAVWSTRREPRPVPGLPAPAVVVPLREALMSVGESGVPLYEALSLAGQFGAVEAYLQVRAVDDERGRVNRPVAASPLLRVTWTPELIRALARPGE